jgi:hypothetical protein
MYRRSTGAPRSNPNWRLNGVTRRRSPIVTRADLLHLTIVSLLPLGPAALASDAWPPPACPIVLPATRRDARRSASHRTKLMEACARRKHASRRLRRRAGAVILPLVKILVIDIGGSHVKLLATGRRTPVKVPSGPDLTPRQMVDEVLEATADWDYDVVSIGYPGPVSHNKPTKEPINLGTGWMRFDFDRAFGKPVRMINDAAMQALGSYAGRTMLFLGLGTGLGNTLVKDGFVVPLELAHLPYE